VASRSDTGDIASVSHAQVWATLGSLTNLFEIRGPVPRHPPLSDSHLPWAIETAEGAYLPDQLTIFVGTHTIGEGTPATEMLAADRNGIDHIINWCPVIARIYIDALSQ
jgi:hypothetical protein